MSAQPYAVAGILGAPDEPRPSLPRRVPMLLGLTLASWIALTEVNRLILQVLDGTGHAHSATDVVGPGAWSQVDTWTAWAGAGSPVLSGLLVAVTLLDVPFTIGYLGLTWWLLRRLGLGPWAWRLPLLVAAVELVEDVLFLVAAVRLPATNEAWARVLSISSSVKWAVLALVVVAVVLTPARRATIRRAVREGTAALWHHRLSAFVLVMVSAVGLVPGSDISDQMPDVVRGWSGVHAAATVIVVAVATAFVLELGRQRSASEWRKYVAGTPQPPDTAFYGLPSGWWLAGPAAALLAAGALTMFVGDGLVNGKALSLFVGVPGLLWVASACLMRWLPQSSTAGTAAGPTTSGPPCPVRRVPGDEWSLARARRAWRVGDGLAAALPAVLGLLLIRSLTAPAVLDLVEPETPLRPVLGVALAAGVALAVVAFPVAEWALRRLDATEGAHWWQPWRPTWPVVGVDGADASGSARRRALLHAGMVVAASIVVVALLRFPIQISERLGVIGVMLTALTAWTTIVGFVIVRLQRRRPLEVFRRLGFRAAPVMTLLVAVPMVAAQGGGDAVLHATRAATTDETMGQRDDLHTAFGSWLDTSQDCTRDVDGVPVRPLVLLAAAGGGIRAAAWTADVLDELDGDCSAHAVLLSSGVSGGSVGLAASRSAQGAGAVVEHLSQPAALGGAVTGLVVGDLVAGVTGVRVPSADDGRWKDRAGLLESAWVNDPATADELSRPWSADPAGPAGYLIFNSAAASTGCRVLLSQIDLVDPTAPDGTRTGTEPTGADPHCALGSGTIAGSTDLVAYYSSPEADDVPTCLPAMDWITAAMVSARFPFVTPAARVPAPGAACAAETDLQLIDGGYAEGSGLGTLSDLAPAVMTEVRAHNEEVAAGDATGYVVPIVVYVDNHAGGDVASPQSSLAAEALVPLAGRSAKGVQASPASLLQRLSATLADSCTGQPDCVTGTAGLRGSLGGSTVLIAPTTTPGVAPPLGWTLSPDSRQRLHDGVEAALNPRKPGAAHATLGDLLAVLDPTGQED